MRGGEGEGESWGKEELDRDHALQVASGSRRAGPHGDGPLVSKQKELLHFHQILARGERRGWER